MVLLQLPTVFSFISIFHFSRANYDASGRTNVAMYWGQGPNQQRLLHFCQQSTVDIIPLAFVDIFPAQGNGFPGTNFGNQCYGPPYVYAGPGKDPALNELQSECPLLTADIPVCQSTYGKKLILSLGGGTNTYNLTGSANGNAFADFLWGAFGPQTKEWLKHGLPRPFDGPNNQSVEVDGFDFDIEIPSADKQAGYIAMIRRLRDHIRGADKPYLITGAPQCVVPDANMGLMITHAKFDIIWVQYYNTPQCSARNWVTANPNYTSTGVEEPSGFSFDAWESFLVGTESKDAKLYIGLPGSQTAAGSTYYLNPSEASSLIEAYYCKPNFGGISIWEATAAENNLVGCGETYYQAVKDILVGFSEDGALSCVTAPKSKAPTSTRSSCTISSTSTTSTASSPSATSTFPGCTKSYTVVSGDYCYLIWTEFGITEAQLYTWNPTLDSNCDLAIGQVLCVSGPSSTTYSSSSSQSITATSTTVSSTSTRTMTSTSASPSACTKYYTVQSGDYCYLIWTEFGITEAQLFAYNPSLDSNCDLSVGQVLCVSESPVSTSSTSSTSSQSTKITTTSTSTSVTSSPSPTATCSKFYTVVSGDYCYLIYTEFGITEAQLYAYNPSLDANCDLSVGQVLCVSEAVVSSTISFTSTPGTTSTTTSPSVSPTPTVACTKFYTVVSGDYCYLIYTEFSITEAQLYAYNPSLDTNCDLTVGQVLCVSEAPITSSSLTVSTSSMSSTTSSTTTSISSKPTITTSSRTTMITSSSSSSRSTITSSSSTSKPITSISINSSKSTRSSSGVRSTSSSSSSSLRPTSTSSVVSPSTSTSSSLSKSISHSSATSSSSTSTTKPSTSLKFTTTSATSTSKSLSTSRTTSTSVSSKFSSSSSSSSTKTTSTTKVPTTLKSSTSISLSSAYTTSSSSKLSSSNTSSITKTPPSSTASSTSKSTSSSSSSTSK